MRRGKQNPKLKVNWKEKTGKKVLYSHPHEHNKSNKIFSTTFKNQIMKIILYSGSAFVYVLKGVRIENFFLNLLW